MNQSRFVILGGGMVAGYAAKQFVELGLKSGELTILSSDTSVPYKRPPLSKGFLAGRDTEESVSNRGQTCIHDISVSLHRECTSDMSTPSDNASPAIPKSQD